jgi:ATP-dependent Lon protease
VKAKILAAHRAGLKRVVLPEANLPDLDEVPKEILADLDIKTVTHVDQVLQYVFDDTGATPSAPGETQVARS